MKTATTKEERKLSANRDDSSGSVDLGLGSSRDVSSLDDDGVSGKTSFGENFAVTGGEGVDDRDDGGVGGETFTLLLGDQRLVHRWQVSKNAIERRSESSSRRAGD